ncbi:imidazole glycerol phosphate synthase subunit HisF [Herbinix luporum]|uniref:Imidazole glycerol phosphate synthase subunit HisF n=1 Tax=Herbinix luporum TaxID=1679721 RepID=A0A0K8J722_9FIRM|nr:imidazole glycerol phosphate synthase subunit HisF [Herbinix luporum]MDI9488233.1 imidazole glycerol phosphate synthase subunit HisF [Bacillota bacterium]CUH93224.1 Imidazole glycerol phosphate synthase subunit HisF [Herbinix luporum]HHT57923.1 imidazole glycerol phosphate synthase subunit HisF [Herbinix luporum]
MVTKRIIPCLDIHNGRVVKGVNFTSLNDAGDPVEIAAAYDKSGADELVFLDISATTEERDTNLDIIGKIAKVVSIPFTVGGGIRTIDDIDRVLKLGASKVGINTAAINNSDLIRQASDKFGSDRIVLALDAKKKADNSGWTVLKSGGRIDANMDALEWAIKAVDLGAGEILLTSLDCDGTMDGYDLELTKLISENVSVPVIASGGAGKLEHFYEAILIGKADAVLAASLFHYGELEIMEVKQYLHQKGINVRL